MLHRQSLALKGATPEEILAWAVQTYFPKFSMATGLGPEGCVIISMLAKIEPRVYVFNLDTGYQFPETLELWQRIQRQYGIQIDLQRSEAVNLSKTNDYAHYMLWCVLVTNHYMLYAFDP